MHHYVGHNEDTTGPLPLETNADIQEPSNNEAENGGAKSSKAMGKSSKAMEGKSSKTTTVKTGNLGGCEEDNGQMKEANPELTAADEAFFSQVETVIDGDKVTIVYPKGPNGTRLLSPSLPYVHFFSSHTHTFLILDLTTY